MRRRLTHVFLVIAVITAAGGAATAQNPGLDSDGAAPMAAMDAETLATVAGDPALMVQFLRKTGKAEIEAGKLAQKRGQSMEVKQLGGTLVRDHQAADKKLKKYAKKHGIGSSRDAIKDPAIQVRTTGTTVSPSMKPMARLPEGVMDPKAMVEQLKQAPPEDFDRRFGQMMTMGHKQTIDLVTASRASSQDADWSALLDELLPPLQQHMEMAQPIAGRPDPNRASGDMPGTVR